MLCSVSDLKNKEVVNIETGEKLGYVDDVEIDTDSGKAVALIVYGRERGFGFLGKDEDIIINFKDIYMIGKDTVLVSLKNVQNCNKSIKIKTMGFKNLFK